MNKIASANQTSDQLAKDRAECGRWAAEQNRGDGDNGGLRRAEIACLEGRGYNVQ